LISWGWLAGCDPEHKDKCEWYLVPEPKQAHLVERGWVSLCARNYVIKKQKCYFKAPLKFAEAVYGKPFKLTSMKYEKKPIPRKIISIKPCKT
jgi:hypothetical protein